MRPAQLHPTEDSAAGLSLLDAQRTVVVVGEEHHQAALHDHRPGADGAPRRVTAELRFAPIMYGQHTGERGIEVLLDGLRVGELTAKMAQRYGASVAHVLVQGGRPGCAARVVDGRGRLEVELRLPAVVEQPWPSMPDAPSPRRQQPGGRPPAGPAPRRGDHPGKERGHRARRARRSRAPYWIGAGVATLLLVIGVSIGDRGPATTSPPDVLTGGAPTSAPTVTITTPDPTTASTEAPSRPTSAAAAAPTVRRTTTAPRTARRTTAAVPAPVEPEATAAPTTTKKPKKTTATQAASGCDSDYSGCVPIASDVDCMGGSGNGPKYVSGPIRVIGTDKYGLDNDDNGIACD